MSWQQWYDSLIKPSWTPDGGTIGTIWGILYPIIILSFGFVFVQGIRGKIPRYVVLPFFLNLMANLLFFPLGFWLQNLILGSIDVVVVWATIVWAMFAIWPYYRGIALAQVPYLIWVSIASTLQLSITAYKLVKNLL